MPAKTPAQTTPTATAYSYVRFSSPKQAEGDSLRRQTEQAARWCEKNNARLDTSLTLHDLGVSAFKGQNALVGNLGNFVSAIRRGLVKPGSILIVESLDRISRQGIDEGYDLIKSILKAGVELVTLSPERRFDVSATKSLTKGALEIQVILERAAEESELKSKRCTVAWGEKKKGARAGVVMTENVPRWLRYDEKAEKVVPIPDRVKIVKRIFKLAASGYGLVLIAKELNSKSVSSFGGRRETWTRSYLGIILKDRRVLGEHQPMKNGKPDGPVIPAYYPAVVTEDEWLAAREGRQQRTTTRGRRGKHVNIFAGILNSAIDRGPYHFTTWKSGKEGKQRALLNFRSVEGLAKAASFPYDTLEAAVLSTLKEINPRDIIGGDEEGPDELATLGGEMAEVESELADIRAWNEGKKFSPTIGERVLQLETRCGELAEKIADARQRVASPVTESWGEVKTLADLLATASDQNDVRLRLQAALRRIVTEGWMVVVGRGSVRLASISLYFGEGDDAPFRTFFVIHQHGCRAGGREGREARWMVQALKHPHSELPFNNEDLRDLDQASCVEGALQNYPMDMIKKLLDKYA